MRLFLLAPLGASHRPACPNSVAGTVQPHPAAFDVLLSLEGLVGLLGAVGLTTATRHGLFPSLARRALRALRQSARAA